jgi:hypothetical protein
MSQSRVYFWGGTIGAAGTAGCGGGTGGAVAAGGAGSSPLVAASVLACSKRTS